MLGRVKTLAMLAGSFLFTFCVLSLAWLTLVGGGQPHFSADPSFAAAASLTPPPSSVHKTPAPSRQPTNPPTDKPAKPTATADQTGTAEPSAVALPTAIASIGPISTQTYVLVGGAYSSTEIPDGGAVAPSGDGVALTTDTDNPDPLRVIYTLDPSDLQAGADVVAVAVRVCGEATGTNYEIDGPLGLSQSIRVGTPPEGDGCWHLDAQAPTNLAVTVTASMGTHLLIRSVEYEVSVAH
jgi:hypothetical protein